MLLVLPGIQFLFGIHQHHRRHQPNFLLLHLHQQSNSQHWKHQLEQSMLMIHGKSKYLKLLLMMVLDI
jgi:hypothetical protein